MCFCVQQSPLIVTGIFPWGLGRSSCFSLMGSRGTSPCKAIHRPQTSFQMQHHDSITPSHSYLTAALQTGVNTAVPQGTAMALHCSVIAVMPQIREWIVGMHDVESQDELSLWYYFIAVCLSVAAGTYFTHMMQRSIKSPGLRTLLISLLVSAKCHLYKQKMQAKSLFYKKKNGITDQLLNASCISFYIYINFCLHLLVPICPLWSNRMARKKCRLDTARVCNQQC
jgi:hypothetical protein